MTKTSCSLSAPRDRIAVAPTPTDLAVTAATWVVEALQETLDRQPRAVWLATAGKTPVATYRNLAHHHRDSLDWSRVTILQMDDCPAHTPDRSFAAQLLRELVGPLGTDAHLMRATDGSFDPLPYLSTLPEIDVALHGIGRNGHVGFNEPGTTVAEWGEVELARTTCEDMGMVIPALGFTLGLDRLARAQRSLLIATGEHKRRAVSGLLEGSPGCPAAKLWPSRLEVLVDAAAAPYELTAAKHLAAAHVSEHV